MLKGRGAETANNLLINCLVL